METGPREGFGASPEQYPNLIPALLNAHESSSKTENEVSARSALFALDMVRSSTRSSDIDSQTTGALIERGFLKEMPMEQYESLAKEARKVAETSRDVDTLGRQLSRIEMHVDNLTRNINSGWHNFVSLQWLGSGVVDAERASLEKLRAEQEPLRERCDSLRERLAVAEQAKSSIMGYVVLGERALAITAEGEKFYAQLQARKALLQEASLADFEQGMSQALGAVQERVARASKALSYLATAGFSPTAAQTIDLALTLSQKKGEVKELIKEAAEVDEAISTYGLNEKQRLHLVGVIASGNSSKNAVLEVLRTAGELKESGTKIKSAYEAIYVAAQIGAKASSPEKGAASFNEALAGVEKLGFRPEWGLSKHLAARLAAYDDIPKAIAEFGETFEALKKKGMGDVTNGSVAALSLMRLPGGTERRIERMESIRELLMSYSLSDGKKQDFPLMGVLASLPGMPEATIQLLTETKACLSKTIESKMATTSRSMVILAGALLDLVALEAQARTEQGTYAGADSLARAHETRSSFSTTGATSGGAYADSGYGYYPWYVDSGGISESSMTPHGHGHYDAGSLDGGHHGAHDFGAPDSSGALCGTSGSHGGGSSTHASCGHSTGHASCGHSSGHASCGHASCGHAGCGHGGCGGGGCGGGGH